jgi:methyl-accepting chemotaxis protein
MRMPLLFRGLKARLLLLAILPSLAGVGLTGTIGIWETLRADEAAGIAQVAAAAGRAERLVQDRERRMLGHATSMALRPDLAAALQARDATALQAALVPALAALRSADPGIEVLEVTDAAGRVLLRAHTPGQAGDDKARVPDVARAIAGSPGSGLTFSPTSGLLAVGAVVPVRQQPPQAAAAPGAPPAAAPIVGTLKVASRIGPAAAAEMAAAIGTQVILVAGDRVLGSTIVDLAPDAAPQRIEGAALADLAPHGQHRIDTRPLVDLAGQPIGRIVVASSTAAAQAARQAQLLTSLGLGLLVLLLTLPVAFLAARSLSGPISAMAAAMRRMAEGDLAVAVQGQGRADEIGEMAVALEVLRARSEQARALEQQAAEDRARREQRAEAMERQTRDFGAALSGVMHGLSGAAGRMADASRDMSATAGANEGRSLQTARDAERAMEDLGSVAAAVEELTASVNEIARQASGAAGAAQSLAGRAEEADQRMVRLAEAAATISDVARLIGDIAGQTNLLALNATIEAARAGEAGKGFAVVANEVKALAAQTAKATGEISGQIQAIQAAAGEAVATVRGMAGEVQEMGAGATAIAAAVEQQGAATREIAGNVSTVLDASRRTVAAMEEAATAARQARVTSGSVESAAEDVGRETRVLGTEVDVFMSVLRDPGSNRRRYERIRGDGRRLLLRPAAGAAFSGTLQDLSLGGLALQAEGAAPPGLEAGQGVQVEMPGGQLLEARVARVDWPVLALIARQDEGSTALLAQLMEQHGRKAA